MDMTALRALMLRGGGSGGGGGGGGGSAELIKTVSSDKMMVQDSLIGSIPAYTTTETTLLASSDVDTSLTLDPTAYDYYILERALTYPVYSIDTIGNGRCDFSLSAGLYIPTRSEQNIYKSITNADKKAPPNNQTKVIGTENYFVIAYFTGTGSLSISVNQTYGGIWQTFAAHGLHYSTGVLTIKSPNYYIKGHSNYLAQTFFEAITDIRAQYIVEVYRAPLGSLDWGIKKQILKIAEGLNSETHTLT